MAQTDQEKIWADDEEKSPSLFNEYITKIAPDIWVTVKPDLSNLPFIKAEDLQLDGEYYRVSYNTKTGNESLKPMYLESYGKQILCFKKKGLKPQAYLDCMFARIKPIQNTDKKINPDAPYYGLRIVKNHKYEDIVSRKLEDVELLLKYFFQYGVLSQFADNHTQIFGIGAGKFAKVFKVERNSDKKQFAVKVYDTRKLYKENQTKWVIYEIMRLRELDSPYCMKLHEIYEGRNYVYCVNEFLAGGEFIDQITKRKSLTEIEALKIIKVVLKGVAYQDSMHQVHRDIKPPNIVLRKEDDLFDLVLVDFGFAIKYEDIDLNNNEIPFCVGTPGYVAPEMMRGKNYDSRADVFSCGSMFYLMLTYTPPFYASNKEEIVERNRKCDPDFSFNHWFGHNYDYNERTIDLLKKMMMKDPKHRIRAMDALKHPAFDQIEHQENGKLIRNLDKKETADINLEEFHGKTEQFIPEALCDFDEADQVIYPRQYADHFYDEDKTNKQHTSFYGGAIVSKLKQNQLDEEQQLFMNRIYSPAKQAAVRDRKSEFVINNFSFPVDQKPRLSMMSDKAFFNDEIIGGEHKLHIEAEDSQSSDSDENEEPVVRQERKEEKKKRDSGYYNFFAVEDKWETEKDKNTEGVTKDNILSNMEIQKRHSVLSVGTMGKSQRVSLSAFSGKSNRSNNKNNEIRVRDIDSEDGDSIGSISNKSIGGKRGSYGQPKPSGTRVSNIF